MFICNVKSISYVRIQHRRVIIRLYYSSLYGTQKMRVIYSVINAEVMYSKLTVYVQTEAAKREHKSLITGFVLPQLLTVSI